MRSDALTLDPLDLPAKLTWTDQWLELEDMHPPYGYTLRCLLCGWEGDHPRSYLDHDCGEAP